MQGVPRGRRAKSGPSLLHATLGILLASLGFIGLLVGIGLSRFVLLPLGGILLFSGSILLAIAFDNTRTKHRDGGHGRGTTSRASSSKRTICPKCRWKNPPENEFCGKCGMDLKEVTRMYDSGLQTSVSTQARKRKIQ